MVLKFAVAWALICVVAMMAAFVFGNDSIPRFLNYSQSSAMICGTAAALVTSIPFIWLLWKSDR